MKYLALGKAVDQGVYREIGIVEATAPTDAEQEAVSTLPDEERIAWDDGLLQVKLYVIGEHYEEDKHVITPSELDALRDEQFQEAMEEGDHPEDGYPRGSDMDEY